MDKRLMMSTLHTASRVMIPTYPLFFIALGLAYLLTPHSELMAVPAYRWIDPVVPMVVWGAMFAIIGIAQLILIRFSGRTFAFSLSLAITGVSMVVWAVALVAAAIAGEASWAAFIWPAFVAQACRASARAIGVEESEW